MISKPHTHKLTFTYSSYTHINFNTSRGVIYSCCAIGLPYRYNTTATTREQQQYYKRQGCIFFFWLLHAKVIETFRFANLLLRRFSKSIFVVLPVFAAALLRYVVHILYIRFFNQVSFYIYYLLIYGMASHTQYLIAAGLLILQCVAECCLSVF